MSSPWTTTIQCVHCKLLQLLSRASTASWLVNEGDSGTSPFSVASVLQRESRCLCFDTLVADRIKIYFILSIVHVTLQNDQNRSEVPNPMLDPNLKYFSETWNCFAFLFNF